MSTALLRLSTLISLLLCCHVLTAQVQYFDGNWKQIKSKKKAIYYRVGPTKNEAGNYDVRDYYMDSTLQMTGTFKDEACTKYEGHFVWYYHSKQIRKSVTYKNEEREGWCLEYYPGGKLFRKRFYKKGFYLTETLYYTNGQIQSITHYTEAGKNDSIANYYTRDGKIYERADCTDSSIHTFTWYYPSGTVIATATYLKDSLIHSKAFNENGTVKTDSTVKCCSARFGTEINSLANYVSRHMKYPEFAVKEKIESEVLVCFVVGPGGEITDVNTPFSNHFSIEEAAREAIQNLPEEVWEPANVNGFPLPDYFEFTINFKLK